LRDRTAGGAGGEVNRTSVDHGRGTIGYRYDQLILLVLAKLRGISKVLEKMTIPEALLATIIDVVS